MMETMESREKIEEILDHGPRHVGIILDGNGRWAQQRGLVRTEGHKAGAGKVIEACRWADDLGIEVLSLYAFSTENWKRSKEEVAALMSLLIEVVRIHFKELMDEGAKITVMGDITRLPLPTRKAVEYAIEKSKNNQGLVINIGLNYGGRDEIIRAFRRAGQAGISPHDLTAEDLDAFLDTRDFPPLDLIIRTGGEIRLSNFMIWQAAYAEFAFLDCYWPDFSKEDLAQACFSFSHRNRRFGGLTS